MSFEVEYRPATLGDDGAVRDLLAAADLPWQDVSAARQELVLALAGGRLVGCAGLEAHGEDGLVRSVAVASELRSRGLGSALAARILSLAAARGARGAYLLTTTAERFWSRHGFRRIERSALPPSIAGSDEACSLCPATAVCMWRALAG